MHKILFVCLGNICRSPMAQAIFEDLAIKKGIKAYTDSAGTSRYHIGEQPDPRTLQVLKNHSISFEHRVRQIQASDSNDFDWILAMDQSNFEDITRTIPKGKAKIALMRHFEPILSSDLNVPDPYYGNIQDFELVYEILHRTIENFLKEL